MQFKQHLISQLKKLQGIPLFQDLAASKTDTLLQNVTAANQITPIFIFPLYLNDSNDE